MQILKGTLKSCQIFLISTLLSSCCMKQWSVLFCVSQYLVSNYFKSVPELAHTSILILIVKEILLGSLSVLLSVSYF